MKKTNRLLQTLIALGIIELGQFYCITLNKNNLRIQARYTSELARYWNDLIEMKVIRSGYLCGQRSVSGVLIDITLT